MNIDLSEIKDKINLDKLNSGKHLLALSGGLDSVALFHILIQNHITFAAAHMNFQLRGIASDEDEAFVKILCDTHGIELFVKKVEVSKKKKKSTQMQARELRYEWFAELKDSHAFYQIISAHQLDDQAETFLINLSRGSGLKGLCGIPDDSIARPLLQISKSELLVFAEKNQLQWREDESNQSNKYLRNRIRNHVLPELEKATPGFLNNFAKSLNFLKADYELLQSAYQKLFDQFTLEKKDEQIHLDLNRLKAYRKRLNHLFWWFHPFGFDHPAEVAKLLMADKGKEIQSSSHRMIVGKNELIISPKGQTKEKIEVYKITSLDQLNILGWRYEILNRMDSEADACIDYAHIEFPLYIDQPKKGDRFQPLGMNQFKKIGKYLKDQNKNKLEKEAQKILYQKEREVIWLINERLDHRFRVQENSTKILNIYLPKR